MGLKLILASFPYVGRKPQNSTPICTIGVTCLRVFKIDS